jgi:hypothetical protein
MAETERKEPKDIAPFTATKDEPCARCGKLILKSERKKMSEPIAGQKRQSFHLTCWDERQEERRERSGAKLPPAKDGEYTPGDAHPLPTDELDVDGQETRQDGQGGDPSSGSDADHGKPQPKPTDAKPGNGDAKPKPPLSPIADAVWQEIKDRIPDTPTREELEEELDALIQAEVASRVDAAVDAKVKTPQVVEIPGVPEAIPLPDVHHEQLEELLALFAAKEDVYAHGETQGAKTSTGLLCAKLLNLQPFVQVLGPSMGDPKLLGFNTANGDFLQTPFYRAYTGQWPAGKSGGLLILDEMDNAPPSLLTLLNGALTNGVVSFPDPIGQVERNPNLLVFATGNTNGNGPTRMYPGRAVFEEATKQRFFFLTWRYDPKLEFAMVRPYCPDDESCQIILKWMNDVRKAAREQEVRIIASPTGARKVAKLWAQGKLPLGRICDGAVWKGADDDTIRQLGVPKTPPLMSWKRKES